MRTNRQGDRPQSRVAPSHLLAAAAILGLLVMPVAFAQDEQPAATKSANVTKQIKKLKRRLAALEARTAPASLPPSGPAGGDLAGSYPSPDVAQNAIIGSNVSPDALSGNDINEPTVLIPTAWAVVEDPDGDAQPAGDPHAIASEGVSNINDGDGGAFDGISGLQCYALNFTPDLVLATSTTQAGDPRIVEAESPAVGSCAISSDEASLEIHDSAANTLDDGDVHVAFFDLE